MVLPNARILTHQPSGGFQGQATDIEIHAQASLYLRRRLDELYSELTGQPIERVHEDMERDRFLSPEEAVEYGLADRITSSHDLPRAALGFKAGGG